MDSERTTGITSLLTVSSTRRGALRFLAGIALSGTALAAIGGEEVDARKKRKGRDKDKDNKGQGRCGRDRRLAKLNVPHDGSIVYTPVLENGRRYRLRVSGFASGTSFFTPIGIDAGYIFRRDGQPPALDSYGDVDMGLSVDGAAASWGAYAANHVYEKNVVGQGERLALRLVTRPDEAALSQGTARRIITELDYEFGLSGSLEVEILCS